MVSPGFTVKSLRMGVPLFRSFLVDQSRPDEGRFVWAYRVRIENQGGETVQLRRRHWRITDALGRVNEVRGPGVVGEQPVLRPGEAYVTRFSGTVPGQNGGPVITPSLRNPSTRSRAAWTRPLVTSMTCSAWL